VRIVLDASAAVGASLGTTRSKALIDALAEASIVLAPDLYVAEVANAFWKYVVAGELSREEAAERLEIALNLVERFVPGASIAQEALLEAVVYEHPVYDLCYAVTARREGCAVLTADRRLIRLLKRMRVPIAGTPTP
jgi:predicted nucleic acid-binding protein